MEHSARAAEVTEQVAVWIENDGERIKAAREKLKIGVEYFGVWVTRVLQHAPLYSAPWQVAQDMSPRDYMRVDWGKVADRIKAE